MSALLNSRFIWDGDNIEFVDVEKAYNPNQPRNPKGSREGGRWVKQPGDNVIDNHPLTRDDGTWGASHGNSRTISGRAAKIMGIEGYKDDGGDITTGRANKFLEAIYASPGSNEPLYHGFANRAGIEWKEGDTFKLPLVATTGDEGLAESFGVWGANSRETQPPPTMFEFPKGTRIAGYSKRKPDYVAEFGHQWSEALTAGEFRVVSTRTKIGAAWWKPKITVVRLEPVSWWNPKSSKWEQA